VRLGWRAILGHVPDLRQSPHPRATANRKDRDVGRGGTACAALPALLHHGRMDRRAVPGHRDHVSSRDHQKQPNNPNLLPFQRREAPFIADDRLNQPSKNQLFHCHSPPPATKSILSLLLTSTTIRLGKKRNRKIPRNLFLSTIKILDRWIFNVLLVQCYYTLK
jgi:hypothetical protein